MDNIGEGSKMVQASSHKINKSWDCNIQHIDYSYMSVHTYMFSSVQFSHSVVSDSL